MAECIAVVDLAPKYNLVVSRANAACDQFVSLTSTDIKAEVQEAKTQQVVADIAAAFAKSMATHHAAQLGSSNGRSAKGGMHSAYPGSSVVPKHEVPCRQFMRGTCRMGAACAFKHEVIAQPNFQAHK